MPRARPWPRPSPWAQRQSRRCRTSSQRPFGRPGCSWPPSGSTWTSTATQPAGCMLSARSAFPRLWLVQLGKSHGLVQLGMPERRETCSSASRRGRVAAQKQWTIFFAYFPVLSPTHARAVVPRQPGAGHPQAGRQPGRQPGQLAAGPAWQCAGWFSWRHQPAGPTPGSGAQKPGPRWCLGGLGRPRVPSPGGCPP